MCKTEGGGDRVKEYDVIVIGSGAGMLIVESALLQGLTVALVSLLSAIVVVTLKRKRR